MGMSMQGASMGLKALNAYSTAKSQQSSMRFQAQLDQMNAQSSENQAQSVLSQGNFEQQNQQLKTADMLGQQRAGMAANGVALGVGSAANVQESTQVMGQIDTNTIAANAMRQAFGYRSQANNYSNDAIMQEAGAKQINPWMSAATSLIGSAPTVAQSWYQKNSVGGFDNAPNANETTDWTGQSGSTFGGTASRSLTGQIGSSIGALFG